MDNPRIIHAPMNGRRYGVTAPITQYDYGYLLLPEGEELPTTYEVDFSNDEHKGTSLTVYGGAEGAEVPEELIRTGKDVFAFYYKVGDGYGKTDYTWRIPNHCRPDRDGGMPTPSQQSSIDQLIVRSNEAVEQAEQSASDASTSAQSAQGYAEQAESAKSDAQTYANNASASATSASQSATASANSATASAQSASQSAQIKSDVEGMVDDAQGYAQASAQSATASANSASQAQGYAQSASQYASSAQTSANTASAKAQDASTSAQTASTKASESAQSATNAQGYAQTAEQAKTDSQTAQGLAESARDSAISAKEDAESAKDDAVQAKEDAESAVASISGALAEKAPIITDTASGAIASFSDGADGLPLKSLVVDINPVQDLSHGDPSPENICPISGWTQVDVEQSGKNLLKNNATNGSANGVIWTINSDGSILFSGTATAITDIIMNRSSDHLVIGKGQMALVGNGSASYNPTITGINFQSDIYVDGKYVSTLQNGNTKRTFSGGLITVGLSRIRIASGTVIPSDTVFYPQIEIGNAPSAFEPYTGRSITINLGQTVYGGKLDVLSGELTIDRAMVDLGTLDWHYQPPTTGIPHGYFTVENIGYKPTGALICSCYKTVTTGWTTDKVIQNHGSIDKIYVIDSRYTSIQSFVEGVTGQQLVYELATPIEIQLSANQINSLLGVNNIWADSGDTTAEYRADTKLFIERLTAPDSADMIADANITSGQYFMVGNTLYKATANIANGASIIVGTNCIRKSLSEALNEINA